MSRYRQVPALFVFGAGFTPAPNPVKQVPQNDQPFDVLQNRISWRKFYAGFSFASF